MTRLQRGHHLCAPGASPASARWASPQEISRYLYESGDIWLGVDYRIPEQAFEIAHQINQLAQSIAGSLAFDPAWKSAQLEQCRVHIEALHCDPQPIGIKDDMHILTIAGTRGGKGTTVIVPNLCLYPGSLFNIDPKGENARISAARRGPGNKYVQGMEQDLRVLDPYNVSGVDEAYKASWNPLDFIDPSSDEFYDQANDIVQAIVIRDKDSKSQHFDDNAMAIIKAIILFAILYVKKTSQGETDCNLLTVRRLLTLGLHDQARAGEEDMDGFTLLLKEMEKTGEDVDPSGVISGTAATLLDMGSDEFGSVLSTARRQLAFLERIPMARVVEKSTFSLDELKTAANGCSLYLCLPAKRMEDCGRWLRMMTGATLSRMYDLPAPATGHPVLFQLDEFPVLKTMPEIEQGMGYGAGFSIKFHIIIQDLNQLKRYYPKSWESFIGNCGTVQFFANNDWTTLEFCSKRAGDVEIIQQNTSLNSSHSTNASDPSEQSRLQALFQNRGQYSALVNPFTLLADAKASNRSSSTTLSHSEVRQIVRLIRPDEFERAFAREEMAQAVFIKGERPIYLSRVNYYSHPEFMGFFMPEAAPRPTLEQQMENRRDALAQREMQIDNVIKTAQAYHLATNDAMRKALASKR